MSEFRVDKITNRIGDTGPQICGVSTFSGTSGMAIPSGPTEYRGGRGRGLFVGGYDPAGGAPSRTNVIQYIEIATTGDAIDFGDLTNQNRPHCCASSTRGIAFGGSGADPYPLLNNIEYITISSQGGASDFGDLNVARRSGSALSDNTRGVSAGGVGPNSPFPINMMEYITIASTGNATDYGDLLQYSSGRLGRRGFAGCSSPTRGIWAGAYEGSSTFANYIEYITIQTRGDAKDFGDLTVARSGAGAAASSTRAVFAGGETWSSPAYTEFDTIDYITIATLGNATDFGNLGGARAFVKGTSSQTRGIVAGGYLDNPTRVRDIIEYITIASTGDAIDFGNLTAAQYGSGNACSDSHGGIG